MLKNILIGAVCLLLVVTISSCKKSCGQRCLHGGFCLNNGCSCPDPYSGYNCDTLCLLGMEGYNCLTPSRNKYLGTWTCTSDVQATLSQTYLITFTANSDPLFMNLNNFNNSGGTIICTMTGKYVFNIYSANQDSTGPFINASGYGNLNNGKITMYVYPANSIDEYFATAVQQ
jgi:hypothetical protein